MAELGFLNDIWFDLSAEKLESLKAEFGETQELDELDFVRAILKHSNSDEPIALSDVSKLFRKVGGSGKYALRRPLTHS